MTRTLNMFEAVACAERMSFKASRGIEPSIIERAARDRAGELLGARLQQRA